MPVPEQGRPTPRRTASGLRLTLFTDGASRGNPGPAGAGAVLKDESGQVVATAKRFLGRMTNNQAEYQALLLGLDLALKARTSWLDIRLDSELLVKQLSGQYRVKNTGLAILHGRVKDKLNDLSAYDILHIRRELNAEADRLANEALDEAGD
ncbi:MAG: ribonuclease HI family protein [Proteobacteria bacterium]|nr:ribonuclease HI family protein [Pseudomonadota bacterium]